MDKKPAVSIPCRSGRGIFFVCGLFLTLYSGVILYVLLAPDESASPLLILILFPAGLFSGWLGLRLMLQSLATVHLTPEGIAVTLPGFTLRRYPAEKLGLFYLPSCQTTSEGHICISLYTTRELIARREAHLCRKKSGVAEVSRKKLRSNWENWFLKDQLSAERRKAWLSPFRRNFLQIPYSPEAVHLLKASYPQVSWLNNCPEFRLYYKKWQDPQPTVFCRGCCKERDRTATSVIVRIFQLPFCGILIWMLLDYREMPLSEWLALLFPTLCLAVLFEGIWRLTHFEFDVLHITPEQLRITRAGKEVSCLRSDQICHIFTGRFRIKGGYADYIAISSLPPEALAAKIEARCGRFPERRIWIRAFRQVPQSDRLILAWYLPLRFGIVGIIPAPDMQVLIHTPGREKALRDAFPDARWTDLRLTERP